jgi:transcriptional regulator with XRE-family HTH domain
MDMRRLVGRNVKRLRLERGLTQEEFADASGFAQQYLSDLERGRRNPTVITLFELADALGTSHVELVGLDDEFEKELKARGKLLRAQRKNTKAPRRKAVRSRNRKAGRAS